MNIKEKKHNASIDCMCSWCGAFADIIIPDKVKLCSKCFEKLNKQPKKYGKMANKKQTFEKEIRCCICGNVIGKTNDNTLKEVVCLGCYHYDRDFED
jgi:hypothetical protein